MLCGHLFDRFGGEYTIYLSAVCRRDFRAHHPFDILRIVRRRYLFYGISGDFLGHVYSVLCGIVFDGVGAPSSAKCLACPQGTYSTNLGANASMTCTKCIAGTFSVTLGAGVSSNCIQCDKGTYYTGQGAIISSACIQCDPGKYSSVLGANALSTCVPCTTGSYSKIGATSCDYCAGGMYIKV